MRAQSALSILMIDVDNFKSYNDTHGHLAGDTILKVVAETIRGNCRRSTDCVARFGGEEFVVVLAAATIEESQLLGERLCQQIENQHIPHGASSVSPYITVSVGGALTIPCRDESFFLLLDVADQALYRAKKEGKNKLVMMEHREQI